MYEVTFTNKQRSGHSTPIMAQGSKILRTDTLYLTWDGELWGVFCELKMQSECYIYNCFVHYPVTMDHVMKILECMVPKKKVFVKKA